MKHCHFKNCYIEERKEDIEISFPVALKSKEAQFSYNLFSYIGWPTRLNELKNKRNVCWFMGKTSLGILYSWCSKKVVVLLNCFGVPSLVPVTVVEPEEVQNILSDLKNLFYTLKKKW